MKRRLLREMGVTFITGSLCGIILTGLVILWQGDFTLGSVVGGAMFCVMLMSTLTGTAIPLLLNRLKIDPAIATGPFVTTFNDILGLSVYFGLTSLLL
jgi:magnesium transporter